MIVGIDVGTQSLKVAVLDESLRTRGQAARRYPLVYPKPGWIEQRPDAWEAALAPAIHEALDSAGTTPQRVRALGICGQLDGCIAVDGAGVSLSNCLTWMDRRATDEVADISAEQIRATCGIVVDPGHFAAKARWLKRHLPTPRPIARFHQPVSYLVERLTGMARIDHALASTSMLYALDDARYDPSLLVRFGLAEKELPEIAPAEQCAGYLTSQGAAMTGLPMNLPVAVGTGDDFSTPLGAGLTAPGRVAISLGTGEVIGALHPTPLRDSRGLVETHAYPGGHFYIENPGWLGGGAVAWLRDVLGLSEFSEMDQLANAVAPGADGLTFIPALTGAMAPEWRPLARGCFYGLTPAHGRGHLIRAVLEGCAFAMRDVIDHLDALGIATDSILLLGGGAKSRLWAQIRADISGRVVEVPESVDTSPIAAALLGAVAARIAGNLSDATQAMGGVTRTHAPNGGFAGAYEEAYRAYAKLFQSLKPFFGADGDAGRAPGLPQDGGE
jgi:xylulokinase